MALQIRWSRSVEGEKKCVRYEDLGLCLREIGDSGQDPNAGPSLLGRQLVNQPTGGQTAADKYIVRSSVANPGSSFVGSPILWSQIVLRL